MTVEDFLAKLKQEKFWGDVKISLQNGHLASLKVEKSCNMEEFADSYLNLQKKVKTITG